MLKNEKGSSAVGILLVVAVVGLIGFAGWYVWQGQQPERTPQIIVDEKTAKEKPEVEGPFSLSIGKFPEGWGTLLKESNHIILENKDTKCSAGVNYSTNTAVDEPDADHFKGTVDAITSKGYSVQETRGTLTIVTKNGEKQIEAQTLQITGLNNPASQKYAYIPATDSLTQIRLSCPTNSELPTTQAALLVITFNKVD